MKKPGKKTKLYIILIIVCVAIALWAVYAWLSPKPRYDIIDLGTFGKSSIEPVAINDFGQITGNYMDANGINHSFIYDDSNGFKGIASFDGNTLAYDINNKGQVAGVFIGADGNDHLFIWDDVNGMTDLGLSKLRVSSKMLEINNKGQVAGSRITPEGFTDAFICDKENGFKSLGTLGGIHSKAYGINDKGRVVGASRTFEGDEHAFIWDDANGMTDLGTLGGNFSSAFCINNRDQILGTSNKPDSDPSAGFTVIWNQKKQIHEFDVIRKVSWIHSLNDQGQLTGSFDKKRFLWSSLKRVRYPCPFVWSQQKGFIDLGGIFTDSGEWRENVYVNDINKKGQILGYGFTKQGNRHIFILNPKAKP